MNTRVHRATGVAMVVFAFVWNHGTAAVLGGTQGTGHPGGMVDNRRWSPEKRLFFEGFEGEFPPPGWVLSSTSPTSTWAKYGGLGDPFEGDYVAQVPTGMAQNEALAFFWDVTPGQPEQLSFATMGVSDPSICDEADFSVEVDGQRVFSFCRDDTTLGQFCWAEYIVDLSPYAGQRIEILFRYAGSMGAYHYLDAVQIGAFVPPPSACDEAIPLSLGSGSVVGSTCGSANHISYLACSPAEATGRDNWYVIDLPASWTFTATIDVAGEWELLWLLDACNNPVDGNCLGAETSFGPVPTSISYANTTGAMQRVYLVVDALDNYRCGDYSGTYSCSYQTGVPETALMTWGRIKRSYQ